MDFQHAPENACRFRSIAFGYRLIKSFRKKYSSSSVFTLFISSMLEESHINGLSAIFSVKDAMQNPHPNPYLRKHVLKRIENY